jgi:hypothetical protein
MGEFGELDGKDLTLDMLTSDTWQELEDKLKRVKWKKPYAVQAIKELGKFNEKVVVLGLIPLGLPEKETIK